MVAAFLIVTGIMSLLTFIIFTYDSAVASGKFPNRMRIPEYFLFILMAIGGALGAGLGMIVSHHKVNKTSFKVSVGVDLFIQVVAFIVLLCLKA